MRKNQVLTGRDIPSFITYLICVIVGCLVLFVRWRYLDMPLERDEGEYAYGGQILLSGNSLYQNLYSLKWPGIFLSYALIQAILGQTVWAIHFGVLLINLATAFMVYLSCREMTSRLPSVLAALSYLIFTIQREFQGLIANSEHFVLFYYSISLYLLLRYFRSEIAKPLFLAGFFGGMALITKQHAIGFVLASSAILFVKHYGKADYTKLLKSQLLFVTGLLVPLVLTAIWILGFDDFDRFWYHTVTYARHYVSMTTAGEGWVELYKRFIDFASNPILWGLFFFAVFGYSFLKIGQEHRKILYPLLLGAVLAVSFGLYFRPHYLLFLAFVAPLFISHVFQFIRERLSAQIASLVFALATTIYVIKDVDYLFRWDGSWTNYMMFYRYPFREARLVGDYLKKDGDSSDRLLVIGAEPEINFYAHKQSVTGYIYSYPFFEHQPFAKPMLQEWKNEIGADLPEYIVVVGHWDTYINRDNPVFKDMWQFSEALLSDHQYETIGLVDLPIQEGGMAFGDAAGLRMAETDNWIKVYRKKENV